MEIGKWDSPAYIAQFREQEEHLVNIIHHVFVHYCSNLNE